MFTEFRAGHTYPILRGGAQRPPCPAKCFFRTPYWRPYGLTSSDHIWCDNKTGGVACFYGSATPPSQGAGPASPKIIGTPYLRQNGLI